LGHSHPLAEISNDTLQRNIFLEAKGCIAATWTAVLGKILHMAPAENLVTFLAVDALMTQIKADYAMEEGFVCHSL